MFHIKQMFNRIHDRPKNMKIRYWLSEKLKRFKPNILFIRAQFQTKWIFFLVFNYLFQRISRTFCVSKTTNLAWLFWTSHHYQKHVPYFNWKQVPMALIQFIIELLELIGHPLAKLANGWIWSWIDAIGIYCQVNCDKC